jgi:hypothetical protein
MRLFFVLLALAATPALAGSAYIVESATATGINGGNLADTLVSNSINMQQKQVTNQITWIVTVTPGTSTSMVVFCEASADDTTFSVVHRCNDDTCVPFNPTYTLATEADIVINFPSNYPFMRCTFDDPGDGTGTVVAVAVRGVQ